MKHFAVCAFLLVFLPSCFAQGDRGSISGTVSDPGGAVVPNAAVALRNVESGSQYETITTQTGN